MATPRLARFDDKPKALSTSGTAGAPRGKSAPGAKSAWKEINDELNAHKGQGLEVEPLRRAKIADRLARDHHRSERTSGKSRGIVKGRIG